jgi:hypothetical protein
MKITLGEIGLLDAEVDRMVRQKQLQQQLKLNYKDTLLAVAREAPDLFQAQRVLRSGFGRAVNLEVKNGRLVATELTNPLAASEGGLDSAEKELLTTVEQKMRACPELSYDQALKLVARENPGLAHRYVHRFDEM